MKKLNKPNKLMTLKEIKEELMQQKLFILLTPEERYFILEESGLPEFIYLCYQDNKRLQ